MRILDRYAVRQLIPVWIWCLAVCLFLSCIIDLFERLDEILRLHIPLKTVVEYYANFLPFVFVRAAPLALLLSAAFVASRLSRHQEFLAMSASGTSLLRASAPFLFVGWIASLCVFLVNDRIVPRTSVVYETMKQDTFHSEDERQILENVAITDNANRLYHARSLNLATQELSNLTILEHDANNRPVKNLYASRAIWTKHGWLMLQGTAYRMAPNGAPRGDPEPFFERVMTFPVSPDSFRRPESRPELMRYGQLRLLIRRLKRMGMTNIRRYQVELISKVTLPLMNVVVCLIAFTGSTQPQLRGNLRGLGLSLGWGVGYYLLVGFSEGLAKKGLLHLPVPPVVWAPHLLAVWRCVRLLRRSP